MKGSEEDGLLADWRDAAREPFQGWDFSRLSGRMADEPTPWSYPDVARSAMRKSTSVLDMGTAGGEVLTSMRADWPARVLATEGWPPNIPVARANLEPLGVQVLAYDADAGDRLPLPDDDLDLIVNRHEAFDGDVARVLSPGGRFLTQQVGAQNLRELKAVLGPARIPASVTIDGLSRLLIDAGLRLQRTEDWLGRTTFTDVAALVYYLHAVPFTAPADFSVDRYAEQLLGLHAAGPANGEPIALTQHRFLIVAAKDEPSGG